MLVSSESIRNWDCFLVYSYSMLVVVVDFVDVVAPFAVTVASVRTCFEFKREAFLTFKHGYDAT